jgi:hypothetical protein
MLQAVFARVAQHESSCSIMPCQRLTWAYRFPAKAHRVHLQLTTTVAAASCTHGAMLAYATRDSVLVMLPPL